jgi:hypothetical protein
LTHEGAEDGLAVYADREELTDRLRQRIAAAGPGGDLSSGWRRALLDHLPHVVGALAGALVANDRSILDDALHWLQDVMGHRHAPGSMTDDVLAGLQAVVSEYPAAATLLSWKAPPAQVG